MPLVPLHTDVTDALHTHYKAMAHAARDAEKRTFAVVMGSSLPRHCRVGALWDARDSVCDDRTLAGAITANANPDDSDSWDNMADAIADFVRRIALEIEDGNNRRGYSVVHA